MRPVADFCRRNFKLAIAVRGSGRIACEEEGCSRICGGRRLRAVSLHSLPISCSESLEKFPKQGSFIRGGTAQTKQGRLLTIYELATFVLHACLVCVSVERKAGGLVFLNCGRFVEVVRKCSSGPYQRFPGISTRASGLCGASGLALVFPPSPPLHSPGAFASGGRAAQEHKS